MAAASAGNLFTFVAPACGGLHGPPGIVFAGGARQRELLVVNQNVNFPINGALVAFHPSTGDSAGSFVPSNYPFAPIAPRGVVSRGPLTFVADSEGSPTPRITAYLGGADRLTLYPYTHQFQSRISPPRPRFWTPAATLLSVVHGLDVEVVSKRARTARRVSSCMAIHASMTRCKSASNEAKH